MVWAFKRGMLELGTIYTSKDIGCFMYWYINAFSLKFVIFKPPCETKTCIELKKTKFWHHIMAKGTYSSPKFLSQMKKVVNRPTLIYIYNSHITANLLEIGRWFFYKNHATLNSIIYKYIYTNRTIQKSRNLQLLYV